MVARVFFQEVSVRRLLFCVGFLYIVWGVQALADPLLEQLRADAAAMSAEDYAVTRTEYDNSGKTRQRKARFDPRQPEGERWVLLERNHQPPSDKYTGRFMGGDGALPPDSYAKVAYYLSGDVERLSADDDAVVYRISRLGPGSIILKGEDISGNISGEAVVDLEGGRPIIREVRLEIAESFKPSWLAKISSGHGRVVFGRAEDGRPILLRQVLAVEGSHIFGNISHETDIIYQDHLYVRAKGG